jgi:hypothetical protein
MTKKHFAAVAKVLREAERIDLHEKIVLANALCDEFESFNPNFNRARFLDAVRGQGRGF